MSSPGRFAPRPGTRDPAVRTGAARRSSTSRGAVAAVVLIVLGLGCCLLWKLASGTERHSYDAGAVPPAYVRLTEGQSYSIAISGGVDTETAQGLVAADLSCTVTGSGTGAKALSVTAEQDGSKATDQIGSFVAPETGRAHLACRGLTAVFVDDADDAGFDYAGLALLLGVIALAVGVPLAMSALRTASRRGTPVEDRTGSGARS